MENLNEISAVGPDRFALALEMLPLHDPKVSTGAEDGSTWSLTVSHGLPIDL